MTNSVGPDETSLLGALRSGPEVIKLFFMLN